MLQTYLVDGEVIDSLDLKALLIADGVCVDDEVCEAFAADCRVPMAIRQQGRRWGTALLPDRTVFAVADVGPASPFGLKVGANGRPCLTHRDRCLAEVTLPPATALFEQKTRAACRSAILPACRDGTP